MVHSPTEPIPAIPAADAVVARPAAPAAGAFHCRAVVPQAITPNDFPRLISLVRSIAPDSGSARALGDGLQWEQDSGFSSLSLTINPEGSGTVIRADLRTDGQQVAWGLGAIGAGLMAGLAAASAQLPIGASLGIGVATLAAGGWVARRLWLASSRRQADRIQRIIDKIAAGLRGELA